MLSLLVLGAALSVYLVRPPDVVSEDAAVKEFSTARAMKHLRVIAAAPHPIGSEENARVREYIVRELTSLGLAPQVQVAMITHSVAWEIPPPEAKIRNIVARFKGTGNGNAVLLVTHYDSRSGAPGASDDGAAVAAILESLRALIAGPPLHNDVIVLITDGEEAGLLGAAAFASEHPWLEEVGLVLNFEARGNCGPVLMFETSPGNGWLIREFVKASPVPFASSFAVDVYKRLPNDTDFTVFKKAGLPGLNFAYFAGLSYYHTPHDNVVNLDQRSLQHHGCTMLALARHFGNLFLENHQGPDEIYFNILGPILVHYPAMWNVPITAAIVLVFVGLVSIGLRRHRLSVTGMVAGVLVHFTCLVAAPGMLALIWLPIRSLHDRYGTIVHGDTYNSHFYTIGFAALTTAIVSTLYVWFRERVSVPNLATGALVWWVLLAVLAAVYVPGGSYLFDWPLAFSFVGLGLVLDRQETESWTMRDFVLLSVFGVAAIMLLAPCIFLLLTVVGASKASGVMAAVVLLLGLLIPHLQIMARPHRWLVPSVAVAAGVLLLVAGVLTAGRVPA